MGQQVKFASGMNLVLGVWLIVSPFILGFADGFARWSTVIVGLVVLVLGLIRTTNPLNAAGVSWVNALLGVWLVISPFLLGFSGLPAAMWNNVITGTLIGTLGAWSAMATPSDT